MEQGEKYFVAKITSDLLDSESGKVKKMREEKKKGFARFISSVSYIHTHINIAVILNLPYHSSFLVSGIKTS